MANLDGILNVPQAFGDALRCFREAKNLSQEELAFRADIDRTFVSRIERGIRQPTITTVLCLAKALGVPARTLIDETEKRLLEG